MTRLIRFARLDRARRPRAERRRHRRCRDRLARALLGAGAELGDPGDRCTLTAAPRLAFVPWARAARTRPAHLEPRGRGRHGRRRRRRPSDDAATVIVGPDLPNGASEARRIASHYAARRCCRTRPRRRRRRSAPSAGTGIVHIAAHAGRRGDDPLLSWIELAGGALSNATLVSERGARRLRRPVGLRGGRGRGDVSAGIVTPAAIIVRRGAAR